MTLRRRIDTLQNRIKPPVYVFVLRADGVNTFEYAGHCYRLDDAGLEQFEADNPALFFWHEEHTYTADECPY